MPRILHSEKPEDGKKCLHYIRHCSWPTVLTSCVRGPVVALCDVVDRAFLNSISTSLHQTCSSFAAKGEEPQSNLDHGKSVLQRVGTLAKASLCRSPCADPLVSPQTDESRYSAAALHSQYVSAASNSHIPTGGYTSTRPSPRRSGKSKRCIEK